MATDDRISELMLRWEELREQGREVSPEELCRDCPELVGRAREEMAALTRLSPLLDSSPESGSDSPPGPRRPAARPLPKIPGYEILDWLGEGGMGVVYRVRDLALDRVVALKMPRAGALARPRGLLREAIELRAHINLAHANIVPIYSMGEHAGVPYFTMKFVDGGSLAEHRGRPHDDLRAVVATLAKVARAVEYLHGQRVLHRDLKPSNILLDKDGEPYVSDFGLAKFLDDDANLTRTGETPGTRLYMAPEQIEGRSNRISFATDVWALGVIFYQLLTGRHPFAGQPDEELAFRICSNQSPRPRSLRPDLPADLERICLRCLEKDTGYRYQTAGELADDLERWLRDEQANNEGASRVRRAWRQTRHHPLFVLAPALLGLVAALASAPALSPAPRQKGPAASVDVAADLVKELSEKRAITLIPETGLPRWYKWRVNEANPRLTADGFFSFFARGRSHVELLPFVPGTRFRLRAEIRQKSGGLSSAVGIYFGHGRRETRHGFEHSFYEVGFNDKVDLAKEFPANAIGNQVSLGVGLGYEKPPRPLIVNQGSAGLNLPFRPAGPFAPGPWRKVAVEILPSGVWIRWDKQRVGPLPFTQLQHHVGVRLANNPFADAGRPEFGLSRALGVYLRNAEAVFRNVTVELVNEPK